MVIRTDLERVKKAKDLSVACEYKKTDEGRRLVATTYSSKLLGMSVRVEVDTTRVGHKVRSQTKQERNKAAGAAMSEENKE